MNLKAVASARNFRSFYLEVVCLNDDKVSYVNGEFMHWEGHYLRIRSVVEDAMSAVRENFFPYYDRTICTLWLDHISKSRPCKTFELQRLAPPPRYLQPEK